MRGWAPDNNNVERMENQISLIPTKTSIIWMMSIEKEVWTNCIDEFRPVLREASGIQDVSSKGGHINGLIIRLSLRISPFILLDLEIPFPPGLI